MSQPVAYFDSHLFNDHVSKDIHPEQPLRLSMIRKELQRQGLDRQLQYVEAMPIPSEILHLIHPPSYLKVLEQECLRLTQKSKISIHGINELWNQGSFDSQDDWKAQLSLIISQDTFLSPGSLIAALHAAGAAVQAVQGVVAGHFKRAFCAVRPPGHHATAHYAMGFCLLNNVALAAEAALQIKGIHRVAILDWDLHHGNGTQEIFWKRNNVLYASIHQFPLYPGTGTADEIGEGIGTGFTINCPLPQGASDGLLLEAWENRICPRFSEFAPDLVLISAGFDADRRDPLSGLNITEAGLTELSARVVHWADHHCAGRLVSILEGGYDLQALAEDVASHISTLL